MKNIFILLSALFFSFTLSAQKKPKPGKYPSLFWEITGNGLKNPSHLFGTMHVSNKLAFHLSDSFYLGIKNSDVVALETNPESWQEEMDKYETESGKDYETASSVFGNTQSMPEEYLTIGTLSFYKYDQKIEHALFSNPTIINNLLYRSYGNESADFEEDTYLDMYIFQCGKKWGKKITGVENYSESMKLMLEAYKDGAKDKTPQKETSYDSESEYSADKLQEAYRNGNLDQVDSINKLNSSSPAFDEKFLYKRNEIQADGIDSIIKSGSTLFVGVGAAHLPGERGVIEILRRKGYKLRPIKIQERDSKHKEIVEKLRVPVLFKTETSDDGFIKVAIPGKFYKTDEDASLDQRQYADMANGSFYMVTRVMTNAWLWNQSSEMALKKVDSLLYENIPGKILSKTNITKNGYKGFDIVNRTRRGDLQRYNIFVTPFELIFFKISGISDYIKSGIEAQKFFGSIQLKEYKINNGVVKFSPTYGGFNVELPHDPYQGNDGSVIYDAQDKATSSWYRVMRTDVSNYNFVEEDTFDLTLMDESFGASEFIARRLSRKFTVHNGYPALQCSYKDKDSSIFINRFIIQGPHYYTLMAHSKNESPGMQRFINSFEIKPFVYGEVKERKDTSLYYTVNSPIYPEDKKIKIAMPEYKFYGGTNDEDDETEKGKLEEGLYRNKIISSDSTGEKIYVSFFKNSKYTYLKDTISLKKGNTIFYAGDSGWIVRMKKMPDSISVNQKDKMISWEFQISDTGSSRMLWVKSFYKNGIGFSLMTQCDTLTKPSMFLKNFFETYTPADTLTGINPYEKKSKLFFADLFATDSLVEKRAYRGIDRMDFDSADFPGIKKAITLLNWDKKKYLEHKKIWVEKLSAVNTKQSADFLKELYYAAGDTVELQYTILESLLKHKTDYAIKIFRDIITGEPPVLNLNTSSSYIDNNYYGSGRNYFSSDYFNGNFMDELSDSLLLTKTILSDLLPLMTIDDYEKPMMNLLEQLVDSNLIKPTEYEMYFNKFFIEAKQALKKQAIAEKKKQIEKAISKNDDPAAKLDYQDEKDDGNENLISYVKLLLPFREKNAAILPLITQVLNSNDKQVKFSTMLILLRNELTIPDTLLKYFAEMDDYRYKLYAELKELKKKELFPASFNTHIDLGKSRLFEEGDDYNKPDSILYLEKLPVDYKGKKGFIYFFKVKPKKDDGFWKIATVGLVPENANEFEIEVGNESKAYSISPPLSDPGDYTANAEFDFTRITETKINDDESLTEQLNKILKKLLYSKRKSAVEFYSSDEDGGYWRKQ